MASFHLPQPFTALPLFLSFRSEDKTLSKAIDSKHRQLRGLSEVQVPVWSRQKATAREKREVAVQRGSASPAGHYPTNIY